MKKALSYLNIREGLFYGQVSNCKFLKMAFATCQTKAYRFISFSVYVPCGVLMRTKSRPFALSVASMMAV